MRPQRRWDMEGRVALVTGASQGIGLAIARALAAEGVVVAVNGRSEERIAAALHELEAAGGRAVAAPGRVERKVEVQRLVGRVLESCGRLDFLVNNAGVSRSALVQYLPEEDWDAVLDTNLKGAFLVSQAAVAPMIRAGFGRIVNLCSIASFGGQEGRAAYAASKAGLVALTQVMAQELVGAGVRVNAVAPTLVATEMIERGVPADFLRDVVLDRTPMRRLGEADEVAQAVLFLLSEASSFITGEVLKVDGGLLSGYFCSHARRGQSFRAPGAASAPAKANNREG